MKKDKSAECTASIVAVRDALNVLNGKWKLPIIIALSDGPRRFNEIQKQLENITPKILANELRELELNQFVVRKLIASTPVIVQYELTDYSKSLDNVLMELRKWGFKHRERILGHRKKI
jgi:DNA-binding HxlR family transcriptional regulator